MTIAALAPLFTGDFAHYRDVLVLPDDSRPSFPASDLVTAEGLESLLAHYRQFQPGDDRRALVSQWSRSYFLWLTVPTVAANLVLNRELPVALGTLEIVLNDEGLPEAFKIPHEGRAYPSPPRDPFERFSELLQANFMPLIEGLSREVRLSRRVLWNNAANYFEWLIGAMGRLPLADSMLEDGRQLIALKTGPDGKPNPMHGPVRYVERATGTSPLRQRKHCCIRYRLPGLALCENCPHIDRPPKGALLPEDIG